MRHSAVRYLPDVGFALVPELDQMAWTDETRADCAHCPMVRQPEDDPEDFRKFSPDTRCCTYHPHLPNFLAGRALDRGGPGALALRKRIRSKDGISLAGISRSKEWMKRYHGVSNAEFGRNRGLRCPYYVDSELSCGIWPDRGAVCRTWHCRHVEGAEGFTMWQGLQGVLRYLELMIAEWCIEQGRPRKLPKNLRQWEGWFRTCAKRVAQMSPDDLSGRVEELDKYRAELAQADAQRGAPVPDVLTFPLKGYRTTDNQTVLMSGYHHFDEVEVSISIFDFIERLDDRPWTEVLSQLHAEGNTAVTAELIEKLYRWGVLRGA